MPIRQSGIFTTVRTEGALLPADLLLRIRERNPDLCITEADYELEGGHRFNEEISRAWNRLLSAWARFKDSKRSTTDTRERWLLPLFDALGYGRLQGSRAIEIDGKAYPVSHIWYNVPIHLVAAEVKLEERSAGIAGAARSSPHSMVQELLNRSNDYLWAFVSNGRQLRLLRDNARFTRQAYLEFDLEAMMEGAVYSDFALLWLVCHQSRLKQRHNDKPDDCRLEIVTDGEPRLEQWSRYAQQQGVRALKQLSGAVQQAIIALGRGFIAHPANDGLRERLRDGSLSVQDYYRQLLRFIYRLIFLFAAEDRDLLLDPHAPALARERYVLYYSTARLRELARRRTGRHADLYYPLRLVMQKLGSDDGCPELGLPPLGSFLFASGPDGSTPDLEVSEIGNADLLATIYALAYTTEHNTRRVVDYRNIGAEELGGVYEQLLELQPRLNLETSGFTLERLKGNERKTSGSYYTPTELVDSLLDSALEPVVKATLAANPKDPATAILGLRVCDPACGSGHFLIAAAHRLARHLAAARTGDEAPAPEATRAALRDVISNCIYGVDKNPMAVELCKVSLWMDAVEPGKPLNFLDHHIKVGNSLLGATPRLLREGLPDEAFAILEGDDKAYTTELKRRNGNERKAIAGGQLSFAQLDRTWHDLGSAIQAVADVPDDTPAAVRRKEQLYQQARASADYQYSQLWADAWCTAFVWPKQRGNPLPTTFSVLRQLELRGPNAVPEATSHEVARLAAQYHFFHWHIEFPEVFAIPPDAYADTDGPGWRGGFDVVLGNPPWERIKIQEKEWFSDHNRADIADAPNAAARRTMIKSLNDPTDDEHYEPSLFQAFQADLRHASGESHILRNSGRFPLCGQGDINTYSVFAETMRTIVGPRGRAGVIVPTGIATDDTTKEFFADMIDKNELVSLYDFENRNAIFEGVHRSYKFCLLTTSGAPLPSNAAAEFVFFAHQIDDLRDADRRFSLTAAEIKLLNPNTGTAPIFRSQRDAVITKAIYRRVPVLIKESTSSEPEVNHWGIRFMAMFHMSNDSHLFQTREQLIADGWRLVGNQFRRGEGELYLPLYEAKMLHQFDHRFASYTGVIKRRKPQGDEEGEGSEDVQELTMDQHANPDCYVMPRYWVAATEVTAKQLGRWDKRWLMGWRDITNATNMRTLVSTIISYSAVGDTFLLMFPSEDNIKYSPMLTSCLDSYVVDYTARQKVNGLHIKYNIFKQLPVLPPSTYEQPASWATEQTLAQWLLPRVLELTYTAWDLQPFAEDCGYAGPPFPWDEARRFQLRCELDAAYFHLYGIERDDVDYVMETFPIVKKRDIDQHKTYRTKERILTIYDAMAEAARSDTPYQTPLDPPPADPRVAHPAKRDSDK